METNKHNNEPNNQENNIEVAKKAEEAIERLNKELDEKNKLNWAKKIAVKGLQKRLKRGVAKCKKKMEKDKKEEDEVRKRVIMGIMEMKEIFNIEIEKYNEKGEIETDNKGKKTVIEATKEALELTPTGKLIEILEDVIKAAEEVVK